VIIPAYLVMELVNTFAKHQVSAIPRHRRSGPGRQEWRQLRNRQRSIGRIIARVKAQGRSALNDGDIRRARTALGDCARWIALTPEGLLETAKREYKPFRPLPAPTTRCTSDAAGRLRGICLLPRTGTAPCREGGMKPTLRTRWTLVQWYFHAFVYRMVRRWL
jgi:hypothetical protein